MVEESTQEWFLEIQGNRTGPFSTEQVLGLLSDGELPQTQKLFPSASATEFVTLGALAQHYRQRRPAATPPATAPKTPHSGTRTFVPPPRPVDSGHGETTVTNLTLKPELGLLEALQAAKDRKAISATRTPPSEVRGSPVDHEGFALPRGALTLAGLAAALALATFGTVHLIKQQSPGAADTRTASDKPVVRKDPFAAGAGTTPTKPEVAAVPPAGAPATAVSQPQSQLPHPSVAAATYHPGSSMGASAPPLHRETDREREERERDRERERERDREVAATDAAYQNGPAIPPPFSANDPNSNDPSQRDPNAPVAPNTANELPQPAAPPVD